MGNYGKQQSESHEAFFQMSLELKVATGWAVLGLVRNCVKCRPKVGLQ